jgi:hypothetical protein
MFSAWQCVCHSILNQLTEAYEILYERMPLEAIPIPYYIISCKKYKNSEKTKLLKKSGWILVVYSKIEGILSFIRKGTRRYYFQPY